MACEIIHGDALEVLKGMEANSVDAIVTDPPYGLSFMGKKWDYDVPEQAIWEECLRVLKPGGHLLAFAGTRTQHRMAVRIEDAGFEIRDMIAWVYGSGFPKSLDVSKAIDKAAGAEREVIGINKSAVRVNSERNHQEGQVAALGLKAGGSGVITAPATDAAKQWEGWGTALKPSIEPVTVARKPLVGTVAENVLAHGTGALNIDGCRVPVDPEADAAQLRTMSRSQRDGDDGWGMSTVSGDTPQVVRSDGRWPANLIHDGSDEVLAVFPSSTSTGGLTPGIGAASGRTYQGGWGLELSSSAGGYGDTGSAARFFYCAKASKSDRGTGNNHPTVKPTELMRYLVRLVTPPGGKVIDPFSGSGSTGKAAVLEGFKFIGIEREAEYVAIAEARIAEAQRQLGLFA